MTGQMTTLACNHCRPGAVPCSSLRSPFPAWYLAHKSSIHLSGTCSLMRCCRPRGQSPLACLKACPWALFAQLLDPRVKVQGHADEAWECLEAGRSHNRQGEELKEHELWLGPNPKKRNKKSRNPVAITGWGVGGHRSNELMWSQSLVLQKSWDGPEPYL